MPKERADTRHLAPDRERMMLAMSRALWHGGGMWMRLALPYMFALASAAGAEPMTATEFEAYVTGKTLYYGRDGDAYGAEIYHPNRRVTWSFLDGECKDGYWYEDGADICFLYEDRPDPQCWQFERGTAGLIARFTSNPQATDVYEAQDAGEEMVCLGPKTGV